jgi:hypothetical protein
MKTIKVKIIWIKIRNFKRQRKKSLNLQKKVLKKKLYPNYSKELIIPAEL